MSPRGTLELLFDELCLRWAREADVVVQQTGALTPTLVLLPRDKAEDEVAIRLEGLRGNLVERSAALIDELRPQTDVHDPAGVVLMLEARLGVGAPDEVTAAPEAATHGGEGVDGAVVYVSLGRPEFRRALGYRIRRSPGMPASLTRLDTDPPVAHFEWLDALLRPRPA